jgi:nitrile hydratase
MTHDHDHDHDHRHRPDPPSDLEARTLALESVLVEKGILTSADVDRVIAAFEQDIGPMLGARAVARAWVDPDFRQRLLADGPAALTELGIDTRGMPIVILENTPARHNMVVCTLCSCYPWSVLGLPPVWYKSPPYRSRAVIEPRTVLSEFGMELPEEVEVNVWDSSADLRYMVLPERPAGTDGWSEEQLAAIVTRDAMIGVARVEVPSGAAAR